MSTPHLEHSQASSIAAKDNISDEVHLGELGLGTPEDDITSTPAFDALKSKTLDVSSATVLQASGVQAGITQDPNIVSTVQTVPITPLDIIEPDATSGDETMLAETDALRRFRMLVAFCALFLAGWNGGSTGAMIPYIELNYNISYARVSVLFVSTFIGYVTAAAATGPLVRRVGFGKTLLIAMVVELIGNVINCSQRKSFNFMCFGFFVVGSAFATQLGLFNSYFARLNKPLLWTGCLHGIYGLGAFASPQVATAMLLKGIPYNIFYTTNVGMNVPLFGLVWLAFEKLDALPTHPTEATTGINGSVLRATLRSKAVWTLAVFLMLYVGAEESLGGWIVSYLIEVRHGDPRGASWVASGMYLGLAVGRIVLPPLNMLLGERNSVFIYVALAIMLECLAWLVPTFNSTAICTALIGLVISTFYSATIAMGGKLIPRSMHADAFSLISAVGQSGSAFWPLIVGIMSTKTGIWVVEPTVLALLGAQGACWWLVPRADKRVL